MPRPAVLLAALLVALPAVADTIVVDRLDDPTPAPAACTAAPDDCSLRGAVQVGNGAPATQITLPAGTYTLAAPLDVTGSFSIAGADADTTILDAAFAGRVLVVRGGASLVASKLTLAHGAGSGADADGGAVKNLGTLSLIDAGVQGSMSTAQAGGISNSGTLVLTRCVVSGNTAETEGGAVWNNAATLIARDTTFDDNHATTDAGGAISTYGTSTVTLTGCTLSANDAATVGGALFNTDFGDTTLTNCTVSGNVSATSGGGIYAAGGTVTLASATITGNTGGTHDAGSGGGVTGASGTLIAQNSIVAGNQDQTGGNPDCAGTIISQGYVLLGDATGCTLSGSTANLVGVDPQLGPLEGNGGPTKTRMPATTSPAVDAANPTAPGSGGTSCPADDQRGVARPQPDGGRCDIGAVEGSTAVTTTTVTTTTTSSTTSTTLPPVEICDDCIDNDGDGLTDLEDPTCCPGVQSVSLQLGKVLFKPGPGGTKFSLNGGFSKLALTGTTSTQDVFIQLREQDQADFLCARIPAANLVRHGSKETFRDPKRLVGSAKGIDALVLKRRKNGNGVLEASGKRVSVTLPPAGTLFVTVGILQPGAAEAANRCAIVGVPFSTTRKGALVFRNP